MRSTGHGRATAIIETVDIGHRLYSGAAELRPAASEASFPINLHRAVLIAGAAASQTLELTYTAL